MRCFYLIRIIHKPFSLAKILTLLSFFTLTACEDSQLPQSSDALLTAFQGGCATSQGRWTDAALSQSTALTQTLQKLKDSDPCSKFVTRIAAVENYSQNIEQLLRDDQFRKYRTQEETLRLLVLAQAEATDPTIQDALKSAIAQTQADLALARAESAIAQSTLGEDRLKVYSRNLNQFTRSLLNETGDLSACLMANPEAGIQIATNLIAMGSSLVSPIYGAGAQVVSGLINFGVETARNWATEDTLWKLYQARMPTALACGLEAMTTLHCQASETYELVNIEAEARGAATGKMNPSWRGIHLFGNDIPAITEWLREVRNGLPPSDRYESERQISARQKIFNVDATDASTKAQITQLLRLLAKETDPNTRTSLLIELVSDVSFELAPPASVHSRASQAFSSISKNPNQFACWFVKGLADPLCQTVPTPIGAGTSETEKYIRDKLLADLLGGFQNLNRNWQDLVDLAQRQSGAEFFDTISLDIQAILQKSQEVSISEKSPVSILHEILEFLEEGASNPATPRSRLPILRSTGGMIREVLDLIELPEGKILNQSDLRDRIQKIYDLFRLKDGPQFFAERIGTIVLWDITDRLNRGEFSQESQEILRYLGGDIRTRLLSSGNSSLQAVSDDLSAARQITESNIDAFLSFFESNVVYSIQELVSRSALPFENPAGADRPNGQLLGKLCTLVLVTSKTNAEWEKSRAGKLCASASYYYPGDPNHAPSIQVSELGKQLDRAADPTRKHRLCGFHRFLREMRVREILTELNEARSPTSNMP